MRRLGRGRLSTGPELTEIFRVFIVGSLRRLMLAADACVISRRCVCINRNPLVGVDDNIGTDVEKVKPEAEAHRCLLNGRHLKRGTNLALPIRGYAGNGNLLGIFELAKPQLAKLGIRMIYVGVAQFNDRPTTGHVGGAQLVLYAWFLAITSVPKLIDRIAPKNSLDVTSVVLDCGDR